LFRKGVRSAKAKIESVKREKGIEKKENLKKGG